jgi:glycerol-3-phosphate dehydrogenase
MAENASKNNVKFYLETEVYNIQNQGDIFLIKTDKGFFESEIVINAAGLNCRHIISMIEHPNFNIYPCRGEYLVLDKNYNNLIKSMIYPIPPDNSGFLGVHITPTIDGNILLGPSAEFIDDSKDKGNTKEIMDVLLKKSREMIPSITKNAVISAYSGIRCKISKPESEKWSDFRIEQSNNYSKFISLIGIESPGLTAAPAIAKEIANMVSKLIEFKEKKEFYNYKIKTKRFSQLSFNEKSKMVMNDERYGRIVCRCENITEAEVVNALSNPLSAKTISSVKYRCRAGMGRCQGGFCLQHIVRIMENDFNINVKEMKLKSPKSNLFSGKNRGGHNDKS